MSLAARPATAQNWTGNTSTDWTDPGNWNSGAVPAGTNVTIPTSTPNPTVLGVSGADAGSTAQLYVGRNAGSSGDLTIQNGSTLTVNSYVRIGEATGSTGVVTVTGAGSSLAINGRISLIVGNFGDGTLNISDNASVITPPLGAFDVTFTYIGRGNTGGTGILNITSGGTLTSRDSEVLIGRDAGSTGIATVTGAGSMWSVTNTVLNVGFSGGGTLTIGDGGTVNAANDIVLAANAGSSGTLNIGAAAGETASGAGNVEAALVQFGDGQGTLNFNHTDSGYIFEPVLSGVGTINHSGPGHTIFNSDNSTFGGVTNVEAGTLSVNGILGGTMEVMGGRLQGTGTVGSTTNFAGGTIAPGNSIGTLTVNGDYAGNGGTLEIESVLGGDNSPTDRLVVTGNTSGFTNVRVIKLGGTGAPTVDGIKIVDVGGESNGNFTLDGDYSLNANQVVVAGAYGYILQKNGVRTPGDGDWYLRSSLLSAPGSSHHPGALPAGPIWQPGVPLYESYQQILLDLDRLPTLRQRVGNRYAPGTSFSPGRADARTGQEPIWVRVDAGHRKLEPSHSTSSTSFDNDFGQLQAGVDGLLLDRESGRLIGGITGQYGHASADVSSFYGGGDISTDAGGVGATLTWYDVSGLYLDGQSQFNWFDSTLSSGLINRTLAADNDGFGYAFGLETGRRVPMGSMWSVTPQGQLSYASVDFDSFIDPFGARIQAEDGDSLLGRLGLSADYSKMGRGNADRVTRTHFYGIANLYYEFLDGTDVDVSGATIAMENDDLWGGLGLGGTYSWADDRFALYAEANVNTSLENFGDSYGYSGTAGVRARW